MLESLTQGFRTLRQRLQGLETLSEEKIDDVLGDVRRSLLEADVALPVVRKFLAQVKEKAVGEIVQTRVSFQDQKMKVSPADVFVKICEDELIGLLGPVDTSLRFRTSGPAVVMLVGLQGSGKTTSAAKLARLLQRQGRNPMLVAADVYRPAAVEQLRVLGEQLGVGVFIRDGLGPVLICKEAVQEAVKTGRDTVILDTAGRLAIDENLMRELEDIKRETRPDNILLVCDAMIGQDAVRMSDAFNQRLNVDGFIMTKLDGDTRGGAILSVKEVTGKPIKFVGVGEQLDRLEEFRPEGFASRILGFGDIVGLVRDFQDVVDQKQAEEDAVRILQGEFSLKDFVDQIKTIRKMGPLNEVMERVPGMADAFPNGVQMDEGELNKMEAIIGSMTPQERQRPQIITQSRAARIARGSGYKPHDVRNLIAQFQSMRKLFAQMGQSSGWLGRIPGLKKLDQMMQMRQMMSDESDMDTESLLAGLKNPFKKKFQPEFATKSLSGDDWKKLKNKRKSERKARKDQHKKKKK
ncbi:MAG TPA: signal recognition particle protein [Acidobacteriota bacterium]|nr:signal recognition particle protein [Acidobacteriota bacterium]HQM62301.1 signal recognition particle protein [Acidobacteriota bacterium]